MTECKLEDSLKLHHRTSIAFGIRDIVSNPILTTVLSRKMIEDERRWSFILEQDLGRLPNYFAEILKDEKPKSLLHGLESGLGEAERNALREIRKNYRLVAQNAESNQVKITAYSQRYNNFKTFLKPKDARRFFENI